MACGEVEFDRESNDLYLVMGEGNPLTDNPKWSFSIVKPLYGKRNLKNT